MAYGCACAYLRTPNLWVDLGTPLTPGLRREWVRSQLRPLGEGAPLGLSQHERFSWARTQGHPADDILAQADQAVRSEVH